VLTLTSDLTLTLDLTLTSDLILASARPLRTELGQAFDETQDLTGQPAEVLLALDVAAQREVVSRLLMRTSELVRAGIDGPKQNHRGADLRGADLCGADLTGSFFLTNSQLTAAKGDLETKLPPALGRPAHWRAPDPGPGSKRHTPPT